MQEEPKTPGKRNGFAHTDPPPEGEVQRMVEVITANVGTLPRTRPILTMMQGAVRVRNSLGQ
jgi:hypothetical protein